jgi:nucleotide-binding universal stress UspA family protein
LSKDAAFGSLSDGFVEDYVRANMHKLLVAIDGSDHARRALDYALKLAKNSSRIELHIVTVQPEPNVYGEIQVYVTEEHMAQLQRQHSKDILDPALEAARDAGVAYTSEILIGNTAEKIVKRAEELGCDGIVIGTQGRGAIGSLLMGSVAIKVVHLTRLPVTLVK